jgi:hypothetical protein
MSLWIGVGEPARLWPLEDEPYASLEHNEGYYWFLAPLLEKLYNETGQMIDLYGHAVFEGDEIAALRRMLGAARTLVESQPESSLQHIGRQTHPVHKELYVPVQKSRFLELLDELERIAARAQETGRQVVCVGD